MFSIVFLSFDNTRFKNASLKTFLLLPKLSEIIKFKVLKSFIFYLFEFITYYHES